VRIYQRSADRDLPKLWEHVRAAVIYRRPAHPHDHAAWKPQPGQTLKDMPFKYKVVLCTLMQWPMTGDEGKTSHDKLKRALVLLMRSGFGDGSVAYVDSNLFMDTNH
jgi:hypothetical protein